MAEQGKKKSVSKPKATAEEPAAPLVNPAPVYVGGESLADRLMPHVKKILIGVGVLAVVVSVFFTIRYYARKKAETATDAVVLAVTEQRRRVEAPPETAPVEPPVEAAEQTYASRQERAEAALSALSKAKGAPREGVALLEADDQLEAGHLDEAENTYRKLSGKAGLEGALAREGLGFVAEARAQGSEGDKAGALQQALEAFRAVQTDDAGPRREYALYHEARVLAQLDKKDEARTAFEAALDKAKEVGDPVLEQLIDARLTQLDMPPLKEAPPKPAAPTTPTTPTETPNP
jgi:tetratricopeptide (TPR) repeat protein